MARVIRTKTDECTGCNKCIMVCPIKYANNVKIIDGERKIEIDESRCITCGKCLKICDHNARGYLDDLSLFLEDLAKGEKISIVVAPSFVTNQYKTYKHIFGYLKSIGVNLIYNVAFGADIASWGYVKYFETGKKQDFLISQPCPAIVDYIEKYTPDLIKNLMPVQSPAICTATYLKKYQNITDKLAFISPCLAKKNEIEKECNLGLINYNIPFERLFSYFKENNVNIMDYPEVDFDDNKAGLGVRFSKPGGLKENLSYHLSDIKIKQIEGPEKVYDYLNFLNKGYRLNNYDLVDILNCNHGCNVGTAACKEVCSVETSIEFENEILNDKRLKNQDKIEINFDEYDKLYEYFNQTLNLEDFFVTYQDQSDTIKYLHPTKEETENAFISLKKYDEESRKINCYSCGYKTCKDMAIALHNNYNTPSSCHQYNRKELEIQKHISDYIRTILEYLTKSIIVTDEKGFIKFVNKEAEKILGYNIDEYMHKHINSFIEDLNLKELQELTTYDYKCSRKNGKICHLRLESRFIELKNKEFLIFVIEDITKQIEMDNLQSNFISMVSHELRTPLTSIKGALGLVSSGATGELPEKAKSLLNIAGNNVVRLANLINEILDLEKIKAGKMDFVFNEYEVMPLIDETVVLNNEYAQQYNIRYEVKEKLDNALINVDKDRFIQVLTNLLSNAAKFSPPNEVVEIYAKRNKHLISVEIVNKGAGIPEESRSKIFESFYQVDSSDSRVKKGSGLGLNICKSLVKNMGGTIGFNSIVNDKTTFYVEFQEIHQKDEEKFALIVEDNKTTSFGIKIMLEKLGYQSDFATNAKQAQDLLNSKEYDLMTLDIMLPDKNGLSLLNEIRNNESTKKLPIIVISAYKDDMAKLSREHGIVTCLEKTFDFEILQSTINEIMLKKNKNKANILHVENDVDTLNLIRVSLKDIANVTTATTISDAEILLNTSVFDVIILDYKLPDGNCTNLVNTISNTINKDAKLAVFSAYDISASLSNLVDAVIPKTKVSNEQFCECIKEFICKK